MREILRGTPEQREAGQTVRELSARKQLNHREKRALQVAKAKSLTRRRFLQKAAGLAVGLPLVAVAGVGLARKDFFLDGEDEVSAEDIYNQYLNGFRLVSEGDEQATDLYDFFVSHGKLTATNVLGTPIPGDELSDGDFMITVTNELDEALQRRKALAGYRKDTNQMSFNNAEMTDIWSGILVAHETLHAYQDFEELKNYSKYGVLLDEQEAHVFGLRLLNNVTSGAYNRVLDEYIDENLPGGNFETGSSLEMTYDKFDYLFEEALSNEEANTRINTYILDVNLRVIERSFVDPEEVEAMQADYINAFSNEVFFESVDQIRR